MIALQVGRPAQHVHRDDRLGVGPDLALEIVRIERQGLVHLRQHRDGAHRQHGGGGGQPGVGGHDHLVARARCPGPPGRRPAPPCRRRTSAAHRSPRSSRPIPPRSDRLPAGGRPWGRPRGTTAWTGSPWRLRRLLPGPSDTCVISLMCGVAELRPRMKHVIHSEGRAMRALYKTGSNTITRRRKAIPGFIRACLFLSFSKPRRKAPCRPHG